MYRKSPAPLALLMVVLALGVLAAPGFAADAGVVAVQLDNARIEWAPQQGQETYVLSVAGPEGFRWTEEFSGSASMSIFDANGQVLPDGFYKYELRPVVQVPEALRQKMQEVQRTGDADLRAELEAQLPAPAEPVVGSFRILDGALVRGDLVESPAAGPRRVTGTPDALRSSETPEAIELDQVIPDDLIVQGSICVGFDCVNNEAFGFDTIRLKENNTRIKFEDTSVGTFPTTDWQLTANDSASGGQNKFSIEDITGVRVPFTIEGGSTTNSIYVDSTGRVGFRTSTPVLDLHVATSNTPGMRLEQNGSGGFTPQTWDIAGNEANFFVRDVTSGSRLPFRIRPGAPTSSIDIAADGDVGIGTGSPQERLHITDTTSSDGARIFFQGDATDNTIGHRLGVRSDLFPQDMQAEVLRNFTIIIDDDSNDSNASFLISINGDPNSDVFRAREDDRIRMNGADPNATTHPLVVGTDGTNGNGAHLTAAGVWTNGSSRVNKTGITPLEISDAFEALAQLQPVRYRSKQQPGGEEYVGFIAEDVPDLVAMDDRKGIASMDVVGVLTRVVQEQQKVIEVLEQRLEELERKNQNP